jgi:hypothetical protein
MAEQAEISMLEQAARAHYEASHDMRVELPWADCHPSYRAQEVQAMRAAIAAMREPTEAMCDAAMATDRPDWQRGSLERAMFGAMIDAALDTDRTPSPGMNPSQPPQ